MLQSALIAAVPSSLKVIVYRDWSSGGTTPWNAGTFSVTLVSCQVGPVSFSADAEHAATAPR